MIIEVYINKSPLLEKQLTIAKNSFFDIPEVIILPADITYTKADCILYSGNTTGDMNDAMGILLKNFLSSYSDNVENKIKYAVQCKNFGEFVLNSSAIVKLQHPTVRFLVYTAFESSKEVIKSSIRSYSCFRSALFLSIQHKMHLIAMTLYQNDLNDFETSCIQLRDAILSLRHILKGANKYTLSELYELNPINEFF